MGAWVRWLLSDTAPALAPRWENQAAELGALVLSCSKLESLMFLVLIAIGVFAAVLGIVFQPVLGLGFLFLGDLHRLMLALAISGSLRRDRACLGLERDDLGPDWSW